ncbi:MAG TPA: condensation domain-containing protein [Blastocatellia bacterium]|nr:condensation domain-containing protein [Blastocatellia bacterium]
MQAMTRPGYRLSPQQRRLWLLEQRYRGAAFVSQCAASITAGLDRERIREALERVVARHEILRTSFERQPGLRLPLQVIAEEGLEWIEGEARRAREGGGEGRGYERG